MGLLAHDVMVIDQVTNFMSNDFAISDGEGRAIGHIETEGSALGRLIMGSRRLVVFDSDGTALVRLTDIKTIGRERMAIADGHGEPLAQLVKRLTLFKTRFTIDLDGVPLELLGNLWGFDFAISGPGGTLATVARQWSGIATALLGHSRYVVHLEPHASMRERQAVLGAVIALDLVREKRESSS